MALAENIVGIIGNVISIIMFLAPVKTLIKIYKAKSTMDFKSTPYVCTLLSVLLWTLYGLLKPATLIITINAAGTFLEVLYVSFFLYYANARGRIKTSRSLLLVLGIFGIITAAALTASHDKDTRVMIAGVVSVVFSIIMYASPLRAMKMVCQTKSVTFMPFTLSALLLLNGAVWSIYALLVKDIYVAIPNGVGTVFGILQILLYVVFMKKSKKIQLAQEAEKSRLHSSGGIKSDAMDDVEKGTLPRGQLAMEQDMKALQDKQGKPGGQEVTAAKADPASQFTNVPLEDKKVQHPGTPPSPTPTPTSNAAGDHTRPHVQTTARAEDSTL